jgi:hypothetical protein
MQTLKQTKVAMIRVDGYPQGVSAPCYLNCKCGAKPLTNLDTEADVKCACGVTYSYNGWIKNEI